MMPESTSSKSLEWIEQELDRIKSRNQYRSLSIRESPHVSGMVQIDGQQLYDFGSNDYLSLAAHPQMVDTVKRQVGYVGWGSGASPLISGRGTLHARLEADLAKFESTEAAITFSSGYLANVSAITSLVGRGDTVYSDERNHASIIDGCRLSGARIKVFRHNDVDHLQELTAAAMEPNAGKRLIATEGLFSMGGDLAPLASIHAIAKQTDSMLLVDEAHATGVFGMNGTGACELFGIKSEVDVIVGTLSKAIGCHGGFVAGSQNLIDWLTNTARGLIFSTAVPEVGCVAAAEALKIIPVLQLERERLLTRAAALRESLRTHGFDVGRSESQIVPIMVGPAEMAIEFKSRLREKGFFVPAIRPPAVSEGDSLLRISLNTSHTDEMIENLVLAITSVAAELKWQAADSIS